MKDMKQTSYLIAKWTSVWPESNADGRLRSVTSLEVSCRAGSPPDDKYASTGLGSPSTTPRQAFSQFQSASRIRCLICFRRRSYSQLLGELAGVGMSLDAWFRSERREFGRL